MSNRTSTIRPFKIREPQLPSIPRASAGLPPGPPPPDMCFSCLDPLPEGEHDLCLGCRGKAGAKITIQDAIAAYMRDCQAKIDAHGHYRQPASLSVEYLRRYARIAVNKTRGKSLWAWVDLESGEIMLGGWKAPRLTKQSRGNVLKPETWGTHTPEGPPSLGHP